MGVLLFNSPLWRPSWTERMGLLRKMKSWSGWAFLYFVIFAFFVSYLLFPNIAHTDKVLKQKKLCWQLSAIIEIIRERFNLIYTGLKFNNAFIRKSAGTHTNITKDTQTGHYFLPQTKYCITLKRWWFNRMEWGHVAFGKSPVEKNILLLRSYSLISQKASQ